MARHGFVEGRNLSFEYVSSMGDPRRLRPLAEALVASGVDVIFAFSTRPAAVLREVTTTVPIVISSADPVGAGLVASLARPGGNVTGTLIPLVELAGKRVQILKTIAPDIRRLAVLWNPDVFTAREQMLAAVASARDLGLATEVVEIRGEAGLDAALTRITASRADALIAMQDSYLSSAPARLAAFALEHRMPSSGPYRTFADAGGLFSYGIHAEDNIDLACEFIAKILQGARPADLPVRQPERFHLYLNARTARVLGIEMPRHLMVQATEVIR